MIPRYPKIRCLLRASEPQSLRASEPQSLRASEPQSLVAKSCPKRAKHAVFRLLLVLLIMVGAFAKTSSAAPAPTMPTAVVSIHAAPMIAVLPVIHVVPMMMQAPPPARVIHLWCRANDAQGTPGVKETFPPTFDPNRVGGGDPITALRFSLEVEGASTWSDPSPSNPIPLIHSNIQTFLVVIEK